MKDTELIRNYCKSNYGGVFDANFLWNKVFSSIPRPNFRKYLTRFVDDGTLIQISKGVYLIGETDEDHALRITNHYLGTKMFKGIFAGASAVYQNQLTSIVPDTITIKTPLTVGNKKILNLQILESNSSFVGNSLKIAEAIELIANEKYVDIDKYGLYKATVGSLLRFYSDDSFASLKIEYPQIVYLKLANILDELHISNEVKEIYAFKTRYNNQ